MCPSAGLAFLEARVRAAYDQARMVQQQQRQWVDCARKAGSRDNCHVLGCAVADDCTKSGDQCGVLSTDWVATIVVLAAQYLLSANSNSSPDLKRHEGLCKRWIVVNPSAVPPP